MPMTDDCASASPSMRRTESGAWKYALVAAVVLIGGIWLVRSGGWDSLLTWIQVTQRELHRELAVAMRAAAQGGSGTAWTLIGLSLAYGVFHAAGPGHGKAVITTYLGSNRVLLGRGLLLSVLSALMQGVTAIVLVEAARGMLMLSMRETQSLAMRLENVSFALVALLGAVLAVRSARALWRRRAQDVQNAALPEQRAGPKPGSLFSGGGRMQAYCVDCGVAHGPSRQHLSQPLSIRSTAAIVLSIGLRPCTGAILVLLIAYSLDMRQTGFAAVLAMSLGTAVTVGALAMATVFARQGAVRLLQTLAGDVRPLQIGLDVLGLAGGLLIASIGIGLLLQGLATQTHPLL